MSKAMRVAVVAFLALVCIPAFAGTGSDLEAQAPKHNCSFCHNLHGGSYSALTDFAVAEDLCLSCHSDTGPAQVDRDGSWVPVPRQKAIHNGPKHTTPTSCWDCHDHEGSASGNLFMIPRTKKIQGVDTTVIFTNNAVQSDFIGVNGVCYVCHTQAGPKANGLNGHNAPDGVCTNCHKHDGGFQGVGGGCTTCHNETKGNHREVVSEFDRASHHIQLGGAGADIPDADCVVCHDQNSIVGIDATAHPRGGSDHVVLINQDTGAPITYDPGVTDPSILTPFCLSCHDTGGATILPTPLVPFSDGNTRPLIDETAWAASSHATSTNADCADCHEVHGSQKLKLLRPGATAPDPTTLYEEEEGFCFQCHSGAGVSTRDIQAQFATPINWSESEWGLNAITTFNDRHDVQHEASSVSGAKIECVNCHRPHADNSSQKYNPDPDPDNTPPDWTPRSAMDAFCADCHDGTFPTGVQGHVRPEGHAAAGTPVAMTNVANTWATLDGMGAKAGSATNERAYVLVERTAGAGGTNGASDGSGDMDYVLYDDAFGVAPVLNCTQCHRPHPKAAAEWPGTYKYDLLSYQDSVRLSDGRALAYPINIVSGKMGDPSTADAVWDFGLTDDFAPPTVEAAGGFTCNACHGREDMNTKTLGCATGGGCHSHGNNL